MKGVFRKATEISDELMEQLPTPPEEKWICPVCGRVNTSWLPTIAALFKKEEGPMWRHGDCKWCAEEAVKREAIEAEQRARASRMARIKHLHSKAGLPPEMAYVKFAELERRHGAEDAFYELENLDVANDRTWLCITGMNNTGKSRLLAATSNRQNALLIPTLYINETLFFKTVKESWDDVGESKLMGLFAMADLVLWDEFCFYDYTQRNWIYERVYAILEQLAESDKKVVFVTNVQVARKKAGDPDEKSIEGRCGKRIWARLQRRNTRYVGMQNEPFCQI